MAYNEFPFDEVKEYLETKVSNDVLEQLYDKYNVDSDVEDKLSALADLISDGDMLALRFEPKSVHDGFTEKLISEDDKVNEIATFLSHIDQGILDRLMDQYKCFSTYDLALAVTDDELHSLGYQGGAPVDGSENKANNALRDQVNTAQSLAGADMTANNPMSLSPGIEEAMMNGDETYTPSTSPFSDDCGCCDGEEDWDSLLFNGDEYHEDMDFMEDIPPALRVYVINGNIHEIDQDGDEDDSGFTLACDDEMDFARFREALDPTLVDSCEMVTEGVDFGNKCVFNVKPHKFQVQEEVVLNKELNPAIFDENHKVKPEVREQLLDYVEGFAKAMSDKDIDVDYTDICLVGSQAGYVYTPESDLDIHLISANQLSPEQAERLFEEFDLYEAEHPLMIPTSTEVDGDGDMGSTGIPVELGIEDGYDIQVANPQDRRYSLVDEEWVNDSDKFEQFTNEDMEKVKGYEAIVNEYNDRINDVVDNDEFMNAMILKAEIRKNRSDDLASKGTMSMGNVVFKELRNIGAYDKLKAYIAGKKEEVDD